MASLRALILPVAVIVLALTVFNLRISREMVDFEAARAAARRAVAGDTLYPKNDSQPAFTALPAFAVAMIPMAVLGHDAARVVWFALSCACLVILLRWSVLALPARRWSTRTLIALTLVLLVRFYAHDLTLGQSNLLLAVLLMAGLGALQLDAPVMAAVTAGLAVFITPYAAILLPWLALSRGMRVGLVGLATVAVGLLVPTVSYGWSGNLEQLLGWWRTASMVGTPALPGVGNISLKAMWTGWVGAGTVSAGLALGSALLLVAVAGATWMQRRKVDEPDYLEFALLLTLVPLLTPHGWDYMLLLATPAVVVVLDRWRELTAGWRWASGAALLLMSFSLLDLVARATSQPFTAWPLVTLCAVTLAATLAQIRVRGLA